jgi:peptide deformylase
MQREFVQPNDPILLKIAEPIPEQDITTPSVQSLVDELLDVAYGHRIDREKPTVVGLAAPQVGISRRIIIVDVGATGIGGLSESDLRVYINPEIVWSSDEREAWCEGCWSTDRVCGVVSRPRRIKVEAFTVEGKKVMEEHEGYVGRIFQHEIDHLNGTEFVNHITDDSKLHWVEDVQWPEYKNNEGWRNWPYKCPRSKWREIKGI